MRVILHGEHLVQLTRFPLLFPINVYLVREDDGFTLIDTGLAGSAAAILRAAADRGGPIRRILLTHAHGDHVGALDALRAALPEAEVAITGRDARFFRGDRSPVAGEPAAKPRGTFPPVRTAPTRDLRHGDRIGSLEVVATPGHTPGHAAFFDRRDATLIAGDALQTRGGVAVAGVVRPLFPFPALATLHGPTALASARALSDLAPSRLAIGHGPVLTDPRPALAEAIEEAARRWER